jgi:hypothetical protein
MNSVSTRRVLSLIWFPFFFAGAFSLMLIAAYVAPAPHDLQLQVAGSNAQVSQLREALDDVHDGGFSVQAARSASAASAAVARGDIDAAFIAGSKPELVVSTGASGERAAYLTRVFDRLAEAKGTPQPVVIDAAPAAPGDPNGNAVMFLGLPLLMVGMITAIVLMQFGEWSFTGKIITVALAGAFASVFVYLAGLADNAIPNNEWILLYAFMLTQAIGWLGLGSAAFVRRYFLPALMTFVLVLGIPSAGGTIPADMSPAFIRWLNTFMPFAQFIDLTRSSSYLHGAHLAVPAVVLSAWDAGGALLIAGTFVLVRRRAHAAEIAEEREAAAESSRELEGTGEIRGLVVSTAGRPIANATITALNVVGAEVARARTGDEGLYRLDLPFGPHHLVVAAPHCEPQVLQIAVHPDRPALRHDVALIDWSDGSGNLLSDALPPLVRAQHHAQHAAS